MYFIVTALLVVAILSSTCAKLLYLYVVICRNMDPPDEPFIVVNKCFIKRSDVKFILFQTSAGKFRFLMVSRDMIPILPEATFMLDTHKRKYNRQHSCSPLRRGVAKDECGKLIKFDTSKDTQPRKRAKYQKWRDTKKRQREEDEEEEEKQQHEPFYQVGIDTHNYYAPRVAVHVF